MPKDVPSVSGSRWSRRAIRLAALRVLRVALSPLASERPGRGPADRILVIRPDHLGDALFTTPALRLLREACPRAEIVGLVGPWAKPVYERNPNLDRVVLCDFPGFTGEAKPNPLQPYVRLARTASRLRAARFGLAVHLRFDFWWGALLAYAAGVPRRVGYGVAECAPFLTTVAPYQSGRHEVEQNLRLVRTAVGWEDVAAPSLPSVTEPLHELEFPVAAAERNSVDRLVSEAGLTARRLLAIHPGTRGRAKLWTAPGWATVADEVAALTGAEVLLTGTAAEAALCDAIAARMRRRPRLVVGGTTLGELVALFERCDLVLGVDSGPLHFAVAAGVPTVHLYGPSDHIAFGPYGDPRRHAVVRSGVPCSPCRVLDRPLDDPHRHDCMLAITPEMVVDAARRALAAGRRIGREAGGATSDAEGNPSDPAQHRA